MLRPALRLPCFFLPGLFLLVPALRAAEPERPDLIAFLDTSFARNRNLIEHRLGPRYDSLCRKLGVQDTAESNRRALFRLLYLHGLLTTADAVDCRIGGALASTYMWHWVSPNPRHALRRLPDSTPLVKLRPPAGYGRYKTWADVDRLPALYLGDLFAEQPRYWHPVCGTIKTFGWCSEREMAAGILYQALGLRAKIKQEGIHVWSEVLLDLRDRNGSSRRCRVILDHTFDFVDGRAYKGGLQDWTADLGDGAQVAWYNKVAHSPEELRKVREIRVTPAASLRLYTEINAWMGIIER